MVTVQEPGPEPENPEDGPSDPVDVEISELQILRYMVDSISFETGIAPLGSFLLTAKNEVVPNPQFSGLEYPAKLDSFYLSNSGLEKMKLADMPRGFWSLNYDGYSNTTVIRSLAFPGYAFYYSGTTKTWGGSYQGYGHGNRDLLFML